jgi:hypothetical protein
MVSIGSRLAFERAYSGACVAAAWQRRGSGVVMMVMVMITT